MKVLFLYPNDFFGPVMTVYGQIIRNLDRSRIEPHVAVNAAATGILPISSAHATVRRWRFGGGLTEGTPLERLSSTVNLSRALGGVARYVRREGIDILQATCTPYAGSIALTVGRLAGVPVLLHVHELVGRYSGGLRRHSPLRRRLGRMLVHEADELVAVSRFMADQLLEVADPAPPVSIVHNGVDLDRFHPGLDRSLMRAELGVSKDEVVALQLGRILQSKRQEDFVRALASACRRLPQLRGLIVGWEDTRYPGSRDDLTTLAAGLGLADRLQVLDARPEAPELIAAADIVVAPSLEESWGLVVSEAMAVGRPVIGARSGAVPEIVVDGETGFLVSPCSPEALGDKLALLASDAFLRRTMGAAGRRRAEQDLGEVQVAEGFEPIYAKLAAGRRRSSSSR